MISLFITSHTDTHFVLVSGTSSIKNNPMLNLSLTTNYAHLYYNFATRDDFSPKMIHIFLASTQDFLLIV